MAFERPNRFKKGNHNAVPETLETVRVRLPRDRETLGTVDFQVLLPFDSYSQLCAFSINYFGYFLQRFFAFTKSAYCITVFP